MSDMFSCRRATVHNTTARANRHTHAITQSAQFTDRQSWCFRSPFSGILQHEAFEPLPPSQIQMFLAAHQHVLASLYPNTTYFELQYESQ
jgi:hypothetical protein